MHHMRVKCFKIVDASFSEVKLTVLKLVKELTLDGNSSIGQLSLNDLMKSSELSECDCVLVSDCSNSQCVELFEYLKKFKHPKNLISPKPEKLIAMSVLTKYTNSKEVDVFYGSQINAKQLEVPDGVYVFEGVLNFDGCSDCLGVLLRTESGVRMLLIDEGVASRKPKNLVRRKRKRRVKKRSKKKR
ncbi:MAG: hypothetical protein QXT01_05145 [Sulfolobales archaeon]